MSGAFSVQAEESLIVHHIDTIHVNKALDLPTLLTQTVNKYPDFRLIDAIQQESTALNRRGRQWTAGAASVFVDYKDDFAGSQTGAYEVDGGVSVPLWNWGQREAALKLAEFSEKNASHKEQAIRLKVSGLLRHRLWAIEIARLQYKVAQSAFDFSSQLFATVTRRVELGDLAKADLLLAESDMLQKKSLLLEAEAEIMHTRKAYFYLTQTDVIPADIEEPKSNIQLIRAEHPQLLVFSAQLEAKKAQLVWLKSKASGQTTLSIGGNTERGARGSANVDSITFGISMPFGGSASAAPKIAAAYRAYIALEVKQAHVHRALELERHEAEHALEIEQESFILAGKLAANAREHLKIANFSFDAGEINLMDYLRIQERAQAAMNQLEESRLKLQRNKAFYNQSVGVSL